ncbi:MAG: DegT/DnrJ/EryC1/StrS family aminotransferase [Kiritimatiellae bacterium]|nr:DegT/DnrJ/EryC1/StrS family aminotransferase [Kiritimatiellia bacterium]
MKRRPFIRTAAAAAGTSWLRRAVPITAASLTPAAHATNADRPALLGGKPVHRGAWARWPVWQEEWTQRILDVYRSGKWFRGPGDGVIAEFEEAYARLLGAAKCLATASGTTALMTSLHVLGVDAGDEVIVSPFTFIASYNAILSARALPVFADTDPATLNLDPATIESRINDRTRAIMPVHIFGMPCDMDPILEIARRRGLAVVEDACQAWLAEYRGRMCGTLGDLGCFSFQESKHLPAGEGGAIVSQRPELIDRCNSYHNCGRAAGSNQGRGFFTRGLNFRMTRMQAALLLCQFDKLRRETELRRAAADHLTAQLRHIPGITTVRLPEGARPVWHLYAFRYNAEEFGGLSRDQFLKALSAEGVPASAVYAEQYFDGLLDEAIHSRGFRRLWSEQRLREYRDHLHTLKGNRQTCATVVALPQTVLLADRAQLDHVPAAIEKLRRFGAELAKAG